jgi:hypothetical protein
MMHRSTAGGSRNAKRVLLSLLASVCLIVGSPVVAASSAASGGAHKPVSATHGDCKNDNSGKHNGYDCPTAPAPVVTTTPPVDTTVGPVVTATAPVVFVN